MSHASITEWTNVLGLKSNPDGFMGSNPITGFIVFTLNKIIFLVIILQTKIEKIYSIATL